MSSDRPVQRRGGPSVDDGEGPGREHVEEPSGNGAAAGGNAPTAAALPGGPPAEGPPAEGTAEPSAAGAEPEPEKKSLLARNRDFTLLWTGETISLFGSQITTIALPSVAVLLFGASAFSVSMLVALQWIPFIILAPLVGVFTDRMRRRPLMQVSNVARFVILGSIPILAAFDGLTMAWLFVAATLKGVFDVVFQVAYQAYLPQVVDREDLMDANAKTQISVSLSQVLGRSAAGGLISLLGSARTLAVDAVSYAASSIAIARIKTPEPEPQLEKRGVAGTLEDMKDGLKLTFGNRLLRSLTLMATCGNMAVSLVLTLVIVFAYQDLNFTAAQVGLALGLGGMTIMIGAVLSQKINAKLGMGKTLILTHALLGIAFVMIPLATAGGRGFAFAVIVVSQLIASFTVPIANVAIMSLIQKATPPQAMGRVGGVALPLVWGANAAGPLLGGVVAALVSIEATFYLAAVLAWLAVVFVIVGQVQRIHDEVPEDLRLVV